MLKSRKRRVVVVTAFVALVAMVVAAAAFGAVWKKEGKEFKEKVTLSMTGGEIVEIESGASAMACSSTETMTFEGNTSIASVSAFAVTKTSCEGFLGKLAGCTVTAATPKTLPYEVKVNASTLTVKKFGVTYTMNTGCSIKSIESNFPELILTPESTSAIVLFHFGETKTGAVNGTAASVTAGGAWTLAESQQGKYGIG